MCKNVLRSRFKDVNLLKVDKNMNKAYRKLIKDWCKFCKCYILFLLPSQNIIYNLRKLRLCYTIKLLNSVKKSFVDCLVLTCFNIKMLFQNFLAMNFCSFCSDFRYKSNGIFVLGVGFFSSDKFRLFN